MILIGYGYGYEEMAWLLSVSVRTFRHYRHDLVGDNYAAISDDELDVMVSSIFRVSFFLIVSSTDNGQGN